MAAMKAAACSKCAHFKWSGKRSCCAVGGAWFEDCGNADDPNVHHTWVEGLRACNEFAGASSGEVAVHGMLRHETTIGGMVRAAQQRNISRQQATTGGGHFNAGTTQQNIVTTVFQQQTATSTASGDYNANNTPRNVSGTIFHHQVSVRANGDDSKTDVTQRNISSIVSQHQSTASITADDFNAQNANSIACAKLENLIVFSSLVFIS